MNESTAEKCGERAREYKWKSEMKHQFNDIARRSVYTRRKTVELDF